MSKPRNALSQKLPVLSLQGITKRYGALTANDKIDLTVEAGSIHAVLGENGAGKSTLMKVAYGVTQPDSGTIYWNGKAVELRNTAQARKLGIGMVFQHFSLFETLSVVENISMTVPGSKKELAQKVESLGKQYNLHVNPYAQVHSLSVGERQRVEIIRCLMQELKLLILDEPTSVLPPQHVASLFESLRKLQSNAVSILYISHKLEEICELCDTATILRLGAVTGVTDPRLKSARELATLMVGSDIPKIEARHVHVQAKEPMLELRNLSWKPENPFGTQLHNINLSVFPGEVVGIAGISGNGQKELSQLISGETIASDLLADAIRLFGQPAAQQTATERRNSGFCFVPEERLGRGAVPAMSLKLNALLTAYQKGLLTHGFIKHAALDEFTQSCIYDFAVRCSGRDALASSLSGGNLQKFIVGRELMLKPKLFFLAQPTWGVDIGAATQIRQRLLQLRDEGVAILVISEELEELFEISDRLYVIGEGRLSEPLDPATVTPNDIGEIMIANRKGASDAVSV